MSSPSSAAHAARFALGREPIAPRVAVGAHPVEETGFGLGAMEQGAQRIGVAGRIEGGVVCAEQTDVVREHRRSEAITGRTFGPATTAIRLAGAGAAGLGAADEHAETISSGAVWRKII